jgi:hypothetical protein
MHTMVLAIAPAPETVVTIVKKGQEITPEPDLQHLVECTLKNHPDANW